MSTPQLNVKSLEKYYYTNNSITDKLLMAEQESVKAVDGISFSLTEGESFAIVGESGCGKSTAAESILNLRTPTDGEIAFNGEIIFPEATTNREVRTEFRRQTQIVFQDPNSSLNPRMTVGKIITEPLLIHDIGTAKTRRERAQELLEEVGLDSTHIDRYPHEFSGGQQQRIAIARALSIEPNLIILDEPVSALDVSVQAQILNLLMDLQDKHDLTYLLISHNLAAVNHIADRVGVMYLGEFVEKGATDTIFSNPKHPYTEALLKSVPQVSLEERRRDVELLDGDVPSAKDPPSGCRFHTRCQYAREECTKEKPLLHDATEHADQQSACFRIDDDHEYWNSESLQ
ncbi:ATP-binding cassette domain-containing protein [Salinadaptatus halalkaliphilus]|uniref:ATP-binding cassette domain-containing protein n=1 Tax=Salinadaptatus halalkaliphilus TaxID=2419781 RepID=A0A4S3TI32_9EURY|nr:oligopeptide/dipeptide ABC transporter ATP-binding protein [Salinadaptatus halalkaliphilus]THE63170.1 ATP-binding cassette domain-containing protein [Salinadaptatus halalkaliphilus]